MSQTDGPSGSHAGPWVVAITAGLALTAAVAVVLWPRPAPPRDRQTFAPAAVDVALHAFTVDGDDTVDRLGDEVSRGARLRFAYTNPEDSPLRYVVVYARDAAGQLHWYAPDARDGSAPSAGVPVETGAHERPLTQALPVPTPRGPLTICAWFTRERLPLDRLGPALQAGESLPELGIQRCQRTHVTR